MWDLGELEKFPFCLSVIGGDPVGGPDSGSEYLDQEMARLQELRHKFGLQDLVTFLGKKSQDTLPYYYSAAEAVVVPSQYESFGMVALESMACGTPVVASQVGGLAYLVQDGITGYTVPASEPEALAKRLSDLLRDEDLRRRLGIRAAEFAQQYGWNIIAEQILSLYREVL
jgi:D-inositol-3-phosphate glycosyltransferase